MKFPDDMIGKIICGDCFEVMKAIPDKSIDLVLTDPPYGQSLGYGRGQLRERYIINDDNLLWLPQFSSEIFRVLKENTETAIFMQWRTQSTFEKCLIDSGFKIRTVAIWDKCNAGLSGGGFAEQYESIMILRKGESRENFYKGNVFRGNRVAGRPEHPHEKPLHLITDLINIASKPNDLILDPFSGSCTTAVACKLLNRRCISIEISEAYCEIGRKRLKNTLYNMKLFPEASL